MILHKPSNWIKGRVRARGARGQHWYNDRRTELAKKHARTQALWYLHLAGDWSEAYETRDYGERIKTAYDAMHVGHDCDGEISVVPHERGWPDGQRFVFACTGVSSSFIVAQPNSLLSLEPGARSAVCKRHTGEIALLVS